MEVINWITTNGPDVLAGLLTVVGGAAVVAAKFSPSLAEKLGAVGVILRKVVNVLGANVGEAKNAAED